MAEDALEEALAAALGRALGGPPVRIRALRPLGGGCINQASRVETDAGAFFLKWNRHGPTDLFLREADGLREMARIESGLAIPRVLAASAAQGPTPAFLLTEFLETRRERNGDDDEALGRGLARLHAHTAQHFGFPTDTYCGATRQPNRWADTWTQFYAERRLRPLIEAIDRERGLAVAEAGTYDRVVSRLPDLLPIVSRPALIHGDLWSGNVLHTTRGPGLVDPACAFADREMEFGITTLFGGMSDRAFAAYLEASPLAPGWRERNPIYQLYHLLNHHLLFGGGYGAQALSIARRYV